VFDGISGLVVTLGDLVPAVMSWVVAKLRGEEDLFDQLGRDAPVNQGE
jgi:hypothetical protein